MLIFGEATDRKGGLVQQEIKERLDEIRKKYYDARHHCYAYRLGHPDYTYRINDDGEPSGSAGKPIYGQIRSFELTNVLLVVARYFGGTKLGVGGLINAYKKASKEALENNTIITCTLGAIYRITFDYSDTGIIMKTLEDFGVGFINQAFTDTCEHQVRIRISKQESFEAQLKQLPLSFKCLT